MDAAIIDRGRGPEIAGTRITVYDIMDYVRNKWQPSSIAVFLGLRKEQVLAAIAYIEEHRDEVMAEYQKMLDRCARGNPPEIQAILDQAHESFQKLLAIRRRDPDRFRELLAVRRESPDRYRELLDQYHQSLLAEAERAGPPG